MKNILIIGNIHDKHLVRFVQGLRNVGADYIIDILDVSMKQETATSRNLYDCVYTIKRTHHSFVYQIPGIAKLAKLRDSRIAFHAIANQYDVINIQYISLQACVLVNDLHRVVSTKVITNPWGSDVYRISRYRRRLVQNVIDHSDYVTIMPHTKFGDDVKRFFHVPEKKCLPLCFGSDVLDQIDKSPMTKTMAKDTLFGEHDNFIIVCGYNAAKAQNHLQIIDTLKQIKSELPPNALIVLPMTYSKEKLYMVEVETCLKKLGVNYKIFDTYLSDENIVKLRKATDLFIHMQTTDAYSSTLHEYLLCGTTVINADWLRYHELEQYGVPYYLANFENLREVITTCLRDANNDVNNGLIDVLHSYKWSTQIYLWNKLFTKLLRQ